MRIFVPTLACACGAGVVHAAEVFKYRAPDGSIVFTDKRPEVPAEKIVVEPAPATSAGGRTDTARRTQPLDGAARDRLQRDAADAASARAAEARKQRYDEARCRDARNDAAFFMSDAVHYRANEDGTRTFYSAEEISQRRAAAKRDMAQFCSSGSR
jgi:hypothetical protein